MHMCMYTYVYLNICVYAYMHICICICGWMSRFHFPGTANAGKLMLPHYDDKEKGGLE